MFALTLDVNEAWPVTAKKVEVTPDNVDEAVTVSVVKLPAPPPPPPPLLTFK
jgi:hypothetical protein